MEFFLNWKCFLRGLRFAEVYVDIGNKGSCVLCLMALDFFGDLLQFLLVNRVTISV